MDSPDNLNHFRVPKYIACYVYQDIYRSMVLNFFILPIPTRNGVGATNIQEENNYMDSWKIYNVVTMLSHWKMDEMLIPKKKKAHKAEI